MRGGKKLVVRQKEALKRNPVNVEITFFSENITPVIVTNNHEDDWEGNGSGERQLDYGVQLVSS